MGFLREMTSCDFDYLVGVLFNVDFTVQRAALIPWETVSAYSKYRQREHVWIFHLEDRIWELPEVKELELNVEALELFLITNLSERKDNEPVNKLVCFCGCGMSPTGKRSKFVMGHDAKLKSKVLRKVADIHPEGLQYAKTHWPEIFQMIDTVSIPVPVEDSMINKLLNYFPANLGIFSRQPKLIEIPEIRKSITCWSFTRFRILKATIDQLSSDDLIVVYIEPSATESQYREGYYIASKSELESLTQIQKAMESDSYAIE